jgi:RNA 2',3'-cyclic 3'-phosphodiesterase
MRVFVALDIDNAVRAGLEQFLNGVRGFAPDARWVSPESLHVTLKFIGEKPSEAVEDIKRALSAIPAGTIEISFRGYGFFPTSNAPRVFWIGIAASRGLAALLQKRLAEMPALDFGTITAREFYLYQSQLMRGGARYTKIARFGLE